MLSRMSADAGALMTLAAMKRTGPSATVSSNSTPFLNRRRTRALLRKDDGTKVSGAVAP